MSSSSGPAPPVPEWWDGVANVSYPYNDPTDTIKLQSATSGSRRSNVPRSRGGAREDLQNEYQAAVEAGAPAGLSVRTPLTGNGRLEASPRTAHGYSTSNNHSGFSAGPPVSASAPYRNDLQQLGYQSAIPNTFQQYDAPQQYSFTYHPVVSPNNCLAAQFTQPFGPTWPVQNDLLNNNLPYVRSEQYQWQEQSTWSLRPQPGHDVGSSVQSGPDGRLTVIGNAPRRLDSRASRLPVPVSSQGYPSDGSSAVTRPRARNDNARRHSSMAPTEAIARPEVRRTVRSNVGATLQSGDAQLHEGFRVRDKPHIFFCEGRVFWALWTETLGGRGTTSISQPEVIQNRFGEYAFSKVRRFVVLRAGQDSCTALAITSFGKQGVSKPGVNKWEFAIIYSGRFPPSLLPDEIPSRGDEEGMQPHSIRVVADQPGEKLDPESRLHLGKLYTIEHNLKVKNFGQVHKSSEAALKHQWRSVWERPPVKRLQMHQSVLKPQGSKLPASVDARIHPAGRDTRLRYSYGSHSSQAGSSTLDSVDEDAFDDGDDDDTATE